MTLAHGCPKSLTFRLFQTYHLNLSYHLTQMSHSFQTSLMSHLSLMFHEYQMALTSHSNPTNRYYLMSR